VVGPCTGEARGSRPDRNRGADDGGRCLKGSLGEADDGGCAREGHGIGGGQGNHPCRGRSNGGGGSRPGRLRGGRSRECRQGSLVAAARWAGASVRNRRCRRRVFHPVPAPERAAALAPTRSAGDSSPGSAKSSGRRHGGEGDELEKLREPLGEEEE
jgi:hypothetical protein